VSVWKVVFRKELKETLRDRRTLLVMIVVPVLLYPALLVIMEQLLLFGMRNLEGETSPIALIGDPPPELVELVAADERLRVEDAGDQVEVSIRNGSAAAVAVFGPPPADSVGTRDVTVFFDATSDRSNQARGALADVVVAWRDSLLVERLDQRSLPRTFAIPLAVADSSIARPDEVGGYTLGRVLPLLLVVITLLGAFYPAIDLAAGEKERGTLETLLTAPVPSRDIVIGKFVTVALVGIVAAGLNLASMLLTFQTGALQLTEMIGLEASLPFSSVLVIFLALVPLAVLFGALFLGIAVRSSSFKEAQTSLTPVYMLVLLPAMLPIFPGIDFGVGLALTPVAGVAFLFQALMNGDANLGLAVLVLASTSVYAFAALVFAARAFGSERVLFDSDGSGGEVASGPWLRRWLAGRGSKPVPDAPTAALFVAVVAVGFFWGGIQLQVRLGEIGLLAGEWLLLAGPVLLLVVAGGFDPVRTLSLRRPTRSALLGGVVLMLGMMPQVWLLGWLQTYILPVPWEMLEGLERLVTAETPSRFFWLLLVLAVTPAVCEELVFRGVLLGSTRSLRPWQMIVLNGAVFGAFHLSFETVIRFLPTATLGIVIAWAVWRSGSIWVGMLMHLINNGSIVVLTSIPWVRDAFSDPERPPPLWLVPIGAILVTVGVRALLRIGPRSQGHYEPIPETS
jgi:sodium transport system permease protein